MKTPKIWLSTANAGVLEDELHFDRFVPVGTGLFNLRMNEVVIVDRPRHLTATTVRRGAGCLSAGDIRQGDEWVMGG